MRFLLFIQTAAKIRPRASRVEKSNWLSRSISLGGAHFPHPGRLLGSNKTMKCSSRGSRVRKLSRRWSVCIYPSKHLSWSSRSRSSTDRLGQRCSLQLQTRGKTYHLRRPNLCRSFWLEPSEFAIPPHIRLFLSVWRRTGAYTAMTWIQCITRVSYSRQEAYQ